MVPDLMTEILTGVSFERHRDTVLQAHPVYLRGGEVQIYPALKYEDKDDPEPKDKGTILEDTDESE